MAAEYSATKRLSDALSVNVKDVMRTVADRNQAAEQNRARLDDRHYYLISRVADVFDLMESDVEQHLISGDNVKLMDEFFRPGGLSRLFFHYQVPSSAAQSKDAHPTHKMKVTFSHSAPRPRVFATDGTRDRLQGLCALFLRADATKSIDKDTIAREVNYLPIDCSNGVLAGVSDLLNDVLMPQLSCLDVAAWGDVHAAQKQRKAFLFSLENFSLILGGAQEMLQSQTKLAPSAVKPWRRLDSAAKIQSVVASSQLPQFEQSATTWMQQIEEVMTQSEQIQRVSEDVGPRSELDFWKRRLVKFQSLLEELKASEVMQTLTVLRAAKSSLIPEWIEMDRRITDCFNEAKDNVRFLYTLEEYCLPLYQSDPLRMIESVPKMINAIGMIREMSKFYNSSERLTSLFFKITNQMVISCKNYITVGGAETIWSQDAGIVINKLKNCIRLNREYQSNYNKMKMNAGESSSKDFAEFSETYVFGRFETFCRRLRKIIQFFEIIRMLSSMESSKIEGIDAYNTKLKSIIASMRRRSYDFLDRRVMEFDSDYEQFNAQVNELISNVQSFMNQKLESAASSYRALLLLQHFDKLQIPQLGVEDSYRAVLTLYSQELDTAMWIYNKNKDNPPIVRDMPPIAGKISWARHLYRRVEQPMTALQAVPHLLRSKEGKRVVKNYNKLAEVLVAFELLYHQAWMQQLHAVEAMLVVPILARHPETEQLHVNLSPEILSLIREADVMMQMGLEIPSVVKQLQARQSLIKRQSERLADIIADVHRLKTGIRSEYQPLVSARFDKVIRSLVPGLTFISWQSLTVDQFIEKVQAEVEEFELLMRQVSDLREFRIDKVLQEVASLRLGDIPDDEPWTTEEFLKRTQRSCHRGAQLLQIKSSSIEKAVHQLIELLLGEARSVQQPTANEENQDTFIDEKEQGDNDRSRVSGASQEREQHEKAASDLLLLFSAKNTDAVAKATKSSLEELRKRITAATPAYGRKLISTLPVFLCAAELQQPDVKIEPTVEQVQTAVNRAVMMIAATSKAVRQWSGDLKPQPEVDEVIDAPQASSRSRHASSVAQTEASNTSELTDGSASPHATNYRRGTILPSSASAAAVDTLYRSISHNPDISQEASLIASSVGSQKREVEEALRRFQVFRQLWQQDKNRILSEFLATNPELDDYKARIGELLQQEKVINDEVDVVNCGVIAAATESLKRTLLSETRAMARLYMKSCHEKYAAESKKIVQTIAHLEKRLSREIKDLDDIRIVMLALSELRDQEIGIELALRPVEECYDLLEKHAFHLNKFEEEQVDALRYNWENLRTRALNVQSHLLEIQDNFKGSLHEEIAEFRHESGKFCVDYSGSGPMEPNLSPREASDRLIIFQNRFGILRRQLVTYSEGERLFGLPVTDYPELERIGKELSLLSKLYDLYNDVLDTIHGYYDVLFRDIDTEKISSEMQALQARCRKLPKALKEWQAFEELSTKIDDFNETVPLLEMMTNEAMKPRHWERLSALMNYDLNVESSEFTLRSVLEAPLLTFKEEVEDICISAVKERDIELKLKSIIAEWEVRELKFVGFKNRGDLLLSGEHTAEIVGFMEDSLMALGSLLSNRYNAPYKSQIQEWIKRLSNSTETIEQWLNVQSLWIYLEAAFVGGDIAKQLPQEAKRFKNIDRSWLQIMGRANELRNVIQCCIKDNTLGQLLPHLIQQLELCRKSLAGYLEKKRLLFPRFFFVSDPVLLEILGQASDSHTIQAHLLSMFDNIKTVQFDDKDYNKILSCYSSEGIELNLNNAVRAEGNVEEWLMDLLQQSQASVASLIGQAHEEVRSEQFECISFVETFQAQIGILGIQLVWTRDSTLALNDARQNKKVMANTNRSFLDLLNLLIQQTTRTLSQFERIKFETLITIHVHQRDIFNDLCRLGVKTPSDFEWQKQTRFYYNDDEESCQIRITDVNFDYQNEFLGCTDRLVITPLTDRCYITLAQAIGMSMGGAPAGPAGTGKTETTKDMGRCLGKYVVVFNCSDQMDFRGLGRIYKGLAQSGTWGCFDEFNRIELPVLSVAAQQIAIVLTCKKERRNQFVFTDGDIVDMNREFGIFITMNPGYAGRQELPENLKINFRTVAMMVPDRQIIIRVKLAAVGFLENVLLAKKFFTLYKLCEEQLTKQVHYDFGLRNILSVLRTLGEVRRTHPEEPEQLSMVRVLRDMNLSKLIDVDEPLFLSLIRDIFPKTELDKAGYPDLESAISRQTEEAGLINWEKWSNKLIQLFETQRVRHGMMTLGPSGSGKTSCIHTLMRALTDCGEPTKEMRMNPKAITATQMFGKLDVATNDWTDGIFSVLWRRTLKARRGEHSWLVLDGPVDSIWIENLNSVLDDNKTLTLANGDRIPMAPNCKIIFEVHNIDNASPATVSRNGMVYMSSSGLTWEPIVQGWLLTRSPLENQNLYDLFKETFPQVLLFAQQHLSFKVAVLEAFIIRQCCDIIGGMIAEGEYKEKQLTAGLFSKLYSFSIMWSVGALLEQDDRIKLEKELKKLNFDLPVLEPPSGESSIFDFTVNEKGQWQHWATQVDAFTYPTDSNFDFSSILVPNVDNVRTEFLIRIMHRQGKQVLLTGEQGTAKTIIINNFLSSFDPEQHIKTVLNFSSATTPMMFQRSIESYVYKRVGATFGPIAGKKMTVFIDDINMPSINDWGDQVANEIVRQLIETSGFYNLDKAGEFITIADVQFVAAMNHPGGGRNDIPERLKRHFNIFNCTLPSNASIDKIFSTIGSGHFCEDRGFKESVQQAVVKLVPMTRKLLQLTKTTMLPTPAKFHYVFNLRDLSRIWQGIVQCESDVIQEPATLVRLWKHECSRVIADRMTNLSDVDWFNRVIRRFIVDEFGNNYEQVADATDYFANFMRPIPEATGDEPEEADIEIPRIYEPIESFSELRDHLSYFMERYNQNVRGTGMDLVFFEDAMTHLLKISRIIGTEKGHALLVGVGGSGKQSLTRLASFIAGFVTFQITLTRAYNVTNLLEDLKIVYRLAGEKGKGVTFIFTDSEIKDESFLEYFNNILASGTVPNLFQRDEIDEICESILPIMRREQPRQPVTNENLFDFFLARVRQNLHVALCFSPVGEKFRSRALKFPALISGCTIDWFQRWPKEALIAVADQFLSSFTIESSSEAKSSLIETMGVLHDGVARSCTEYFNKYRRSAFVTPKSYLSFLQGYKKVYSQKLQLYGGLAQRMDSGLDKLQEAQSSVKTLSEELVIKEQELEVANKEAERVLQQVAIQQNEAQEVKNMVQSVKDKAQELVDSIAQDKALAEGKLEAAKPALEAAEEALNTIKPADISNVRRLGSPPHLIMRIMDCVLILFNKKLEKYEVDYDRLCAKPSWAESLRMMATVGFLNMLTQFEKDNMNDEVLELMMPYFEMDDYNKESAARAGFVAGLLSWTKAMADFHRINKEVIPLKDNLAAQEIRLIKANEDLEMAQHQLDEKEAELTKVRSVYESAIKKKRKLEEDAATCRRKMNAAEELITSLAGEKERWTRQSSEYKAEIGRLIGDVLIATAFLSYAGPFNQDFRQSLIQTWRGYLSEKFIPCSTKLNLIEMLVEPTTISKWNLQGLPSDDLSTENGIIATQATRYPLLVDPQAQGKTWIKNKEAPNEIQVTSLDHKYFRQHLEDALSLGRPLLIEDVGEELDPAIDHILEKDFIRQGSRMKVKIGDKEVDVMRGFSLYMTTKLPNPRYSPEAFAKASIIDFTVTAKGLEDQLLGRVIKQEKSELEESKVRLMEDVTSNKIILKKLEDALLSRLASTKGSLVDDEELITVLRETKVTSTEVKLKIEIATETELKINVAREEYRPVAERASILYFLITEMSMINAMYQTSLRQFLGLFDSSLQNSKRRPTTAQRVAEIINHMTFRVWNYAVRGLYDADRLTFSLLLALKVDMNAHRALEEEFQVLIKGGASLDLNSVMQKPHKWILDATWLNLVALSTLSQFSGILEKIANNEKLWKRWFDHGSPEEEPLPCGLDVIDTFQRLLLIRCWCPDRMVMQVKNYITASLGAQFADSFLLDVEAVWHESEPRTPMVGLLSMGSDPTATIESIARRQKIECTVISMGQGQEVHARRLVAGFMVSGGWVILQNCHLSLDYMLELLDELQLTESIHDNFRIWVTCEVHPKFPISFLQQSIKFTNEPPQGIRAGLTRTFTSFTQDFLDVSVATQWKPMLYCVAFLHTVVQERRKFGPIGWNIPYEFNTADMNASIEFVHNHLDDLTAKTSINWSAVRYMLSEIQYGGRVTDDYDQILLSTLCELWFTDKIFEPSFEFHKGYTIPRVSKLSEFLDYIYSLPANDTPQVFGLHPNADISFQGRSAQAILDCILSIQPKDSSGESGESRESTVYKQAEDLLQKLPDDFVAFKVKERITAMGAGQPMNIFLRQEIGRMQKVISAVRSTLTDLRLAIDGTIIMSEELRDALDSMYDAKIPKLWSRISWDSSALGFWFTELIDRYNQFYSWTFQAKPTSFWLTGMFNPQGFLTAMRQDVTRAHDGWALDNVVLHNDVTEFYSSDSKQPPDEGVYVHGLYLEGASWDRRRRCLAEPKPKILNDPMPIVHIYAVNEVKRAERLYDCPVYKKPKRTDLTYIAALKLPTNNKMQAQHWVMRGVALLCDVK